MKKLIVETKDMLSVEQSDFLNKNYMYISPEGELQIGEIGLLNWAKNNGKQKWSKELIEEYIKARLDANKFFSEDSTVRGEEYLKEILKEFYLDSVYFSDVRYLPCFGETRLGQMRTYAKYSENIEYVHKIAVEIKPAIKNIIRNHNISKIAYIPSSIINRKMQFLTELKKCLNLTLEEIQLEKIKPIAQKTFKTIRGRIENAKKTIILSKVSRDKVKGENILIIDDTTVSGATLNETAAILKSAGATKVIGYSIVGSANGLGITEYFRNTKDGSKRW